MSEREASSFRDPSGFVFYRGGKVMRQVNQAYRETYERLSKVGLFEHLMEKGWLIPHREIEGGFPDPKAGYKLLEADKVAFISYPYEWCFSQLKDAALLTLDIQLAIIKKGFSLKDASGYNIQFHQGRPVFIDTLSFEPYEAGAPWVAYRQFCQHFLAPLALMARGDPRLNSLLALYTDGIPLGLASRLLPGRSRFGLGLGLHIHAHARSQNKYAGDVGEENFKLPHKKISRNQMLGLIDSLHSAVSDVRWKLNQSEWGEYYGHTSYSDASLAIKKKLIANMIATVRPAALWDFGANTGVFSRIASEQGVFTVAFDIDRVAVEKNYSAVKKNGEKQLLPLVQDFHAPSAGIGWENRERKSLEERGPVDLVLALALIHHLAIGNNVPLADCARFFARYARHLVIEFVPRLDSQVQRMLRTREDVFSNYDEPSFRRAFERYFTQRSREPIAGSERILFLYQRVQIPAA